mmetsp:Transcript_11835/g.33286  ORF Transcript_11835/g.33286 Transcript_11835/m.33286 type:complete len:424 (-) Transcript_11835:152-1423(-)
MSGVAGTPVAALERLIRERDEEIHFWRLRCRQAEAEVRALQKRLAPPPAPPAGCSASPGGGSSPSGASLGVAAAGSAAAIAAQGAAAAVAEGRRKAVQEEVEKLMGELEEKAAALQQMQADSARDRQQLERRKRAADAQNSICNEELREMTRRAEKLAEQVKRSRGATQEIQQTHEEVARLRTSLEESEARLRKGAGANVFLPSSPRLDASPLPPPPTSTLSSVASSQPPPSLAQVPSTGALSDAAGTSEVLQVLQSIDGIRRMHKELKVEQHIFRQHHAGAKPAAFGGKGGGSAASLSADRLLGQISRKLDRLQRLAVAKDLLMRPGDDAASTPSASASAAAGGRGAARGRPAAAAARKAKAKAKAGPPEIEEDVMLEASKLGLDVVLRPWTPCRIGSCLVRSSITTNSTASSPWRRWQRSL